MPKKLNIVEPVKKVESKPKLPKKLKIVESKKVEPKTKLPKKLKIKEPRTIGKDLTGLSKSQMNKLSPLELMGKLPVELRKNVLAPKKTGVKVGGIPVEKMTVNELDPDDELLEAESWERRKDYDKILKDNLDFADYFYFTNGKNRNTTRHSLIQQKVNDVLIPKIFKVRKSLLTAFKKKYKGQVMRYNVAEDLFMKLYKETYEKKNRR